MPQDSRSSLRIGILETTAQEARGIERVLVEGGFDSVVTWTDVREFEAAGGMNELDLVLVDPEVAGLDDSPGLQRVSAAGDAPAPPILAVLQRDEPTLRRRALGMGALSAIAAPFEAQDLLANVRTILAARRRELDLWDRTRWLEQQLHEGLEHLRDTTRQRHELGVRLVDAQEEERRRVAADVHDGSIQTLTALRIRLGMLAGTQPGPEQTAQIERLDRMCSDALAQLRSLVAELATPTLGLEELAVNIREYLATTGGRPGTPISFVAQNTASLSTEAQLVLFRIAQEAITNARKHVPDAALSILLSDEGDGVKLEVRDGGCGFDSSRPPQPGHLGLTLMKDRAAMVGGWCRIDSTPGTGTTVLAWVPAGPSAGSTS